MAKKKVKGYMVGKWSEYIETTLQGTGIFFYRRSRAVYFNEQVERIEYQDLPFGINPFATQYAHNIS